VVGVNRWGNLPIWSPNRRGLLFRAGDQIIAVGYTAMGDTFVPEKPRVWLASLEGTDWDVAHDRTHLVVVEARIDNVFQTHTHTLEWP
jgi:hypothetical protein